MSGAAREDGYSIHIDWNALLKNRDQSAYELLNQDQISGLGGKIANEMDKNSFQVLRKDQTNISVPGVDWMHISNIGFINGKLHVQINPDNEMGDTIMDFSILQMRRGISWIFPNTPSAMVII